MGTSYTFLKQEMQESTLRNSNMEPKNGSLEDDFPFQSRNFEVPC